MEPSPARLRPSEARTHPRWPTTPTRHGGETRRGNRDLSNTTESTNTTTVWKMALSNVPIQLHGLRRNHLSKGWHNITSLPFEYHWPRLLSSACGAIKNKAMQPEETCTHQDRQMCKHCLRITGS